MPAPVLPLDVGIGLRQAHAEEINSASQTDLMISWLEVHTENYLVPGGPRLSLLEDIRCQYPISCHGVGLSLGSAEGLDTDHLSLLQKFYAHFEPAAVSEHISWSVNNGTYLNDLLPLPLTEEALDTVCRNIDHAQSAFKRTILVENPSTYVSFGHSTMPEWEFLNEICKRTDCGLLFDVNNLYVSAVNHDFDPSVYLDNLDGSKIGEFHLAGHTVTHDEIGTLLIDTHNAPISNAVWTLYDEALDRFGARPTLVEWDLDIPPLQDLLEEAAIARSHLHKTTGKQLTDV